jgi:hypothetical protein
VSPRQERCPAGVRAGEVASAGVVALRHRLPHAATRKFHNGNGEGRRRSTSFFWCPYLLHSLFFFLPTGAALVGCTAAARAPGRAPRRWSAAPLLLGHRALFLDCGTVSRKVIDFFVKRLVPVRSKPSIRSIRRLRKSRDVACLCGLGIGQESYVKDVKILK